MRVFTCILLCASIPSTLALQAPEPRQAATTTPPDPNFSANAAQLISLYVPSSIQSLLYSYYTSIESTTGNVASIIESAFTATAHPTWLDALPSEYQSNIEALESAVQSLRAAVTGGLGASVTEIVGTRSRTGVQSGSTGTVSESASTSRSEESGTMTSSSGSTGTTGQGSVSTTPTVSLRSGATSSGSSGFGMPTRVPVEVAGVLGLVGAVLVL
ncbi:hypothetical protein BCR34DRAFT_243239 [Clohesyomyces aquaticus]|uniref:Hydrophobic surface binding protein A-domain-containing protein n=1 Tax=Clohesyomyces aquaticus TaxID=1231657 RepID=A0A1Y1Y596_9PLEO|nr:hypothetical protein BCR34DRAFT_243239 [Clohesyomyces aquaticus]